MGIASLVKLRQSNKSGSVRNGEIIRLHFGSASLVPTAKHLSHLLILSAQTINQEKTKKREIRYNFQQIILYYLGLHTQNPGLREVDLEPSPKRGSDKINMQKQGRNTQKKASYIIQPGVTYGSQHLER